MNRRAFLTTSGVFGGLAIAGCLGSDDPDVHDADYASDVEGTPGDTDDNGYATYVVRDQPVPLAPTSEVAEWYESDPALVIADARSPEEYDQLHIEGAVLSPAPDGLSSDDPLLELDQDTRIVTYCVCPHTLAGSRAATLMEAGYTSVYALDEGLQEWVDRDLPISQ